MIAGVSVHDACPDYQTARSVIATWGGALMGLGYTIEVDGVCGWSFDLALSGPFSGAERIVNDTVTISGAGIDITATFLPQVLAPRTATPIDDPAFAFQNGMTYRFQWSHPSDLQPSDKPPTMAWHSTDEHGSWSATGTGEGDVMTFVASVSADAVSPDGFAVFRVGHDAGSALTCEGAAVCLYDQLHFFGHEATSQ
jgi:hypothetical protein